jgi:putative FmdB family regulatory protein
VRWWQGLAAGLNINGGRNDTMPIYEYVCKACGKEFMMQQPMASNVEDTACPYCKAKQAEKKVSPFSSQDKDRSNCDKGLSRGGG